MRTAASILFFCAVAVARIALAETVVNSTFVGGGDSLNRYSNPANWSPAEVPNNSADKIYNVTTPVGSRLTLDADATVANFTVGGLSFGLGGHSYTVTGTTTVNANAAFGLVAGIFTIEGALSNFDGPTKTLRDGSYGVQGGDNATGTPCVFRFSDADIVNNGAAISFFGKATITDSTGRDALRNFSRNLTSGSFSVSGGDYTITNVFTNDGSLAVGGGTFASGRLTVAGGLTNYDAAAKRLSGGVYQIAASSGSTSGIPAQEAHLIVSGADIVRNSASIHLKLVGNGNVTAATFTDENGNNALRNLTDNEAGGVFELNRSFRFQPLQLASDFTNAGTIWLTLSSVQIPASHVYRQVAGGTTILGGGGIDGDAEILGGQFIAVEVLDPTTHASVFVGSGVSGNVTITDALFVPIDLGVGSLRLSENSRFLFESGITRAGLSVKATLSLAGTLEIGPLAVSNTETYKVAHAATISGVFSNAPNGSRVSTIDGKGSFVVNYTSTDVTLSNYLPTQPVVRMLNISTRAQVLTGDQVAIGGFIITGNDWKNVLIRAIGPSLASAGVGGALQDPVIELHNSKGAVIARSDNWQDKQSRELLETKLAPKDPRESAIFAALPPGAYTAVVRGTNDTTGTALVEVYDFSSDSPTKLANISTRGFVDANNVLIGGLIAGGGAQDHVQVVVRGIGAGLQSSGVPNFLPDAALEVRDQNGGLIVANDDFGTPSSNPSTVPTALQPQNPTDAATGLTFAPGQYTVIVHGKNGASGNALVEIYDVTGSAGT